ncbi:MAG: cache domain-containing protein [Actinomycetota bacterium]|nr:cache domain-containing protein [Actinomycetota bacterium]
MEAPPSVAVLTEQIGAVSVEVGHCAELLATLLDDQEGVPELLASWSRETLGRWPDLLLGAGAAIDDGSRCRLHWWQLGGSGLDVLLVDVDPSSMGYYDFTRSKWYTGPRKSGTSHLTGPYVDYLGTDRYVATMTAPILVGDEFHGVAGVDFDLSKLERRFLAASRGSAGHLALTNGEGRIIASDARGLSCGELLDQGELVSVVPTGTDEAWMLWELG